MSVKSSVTSGRATSHQANFLRQLEGLKRHWPTVGYAFAVALAALAIMVGLPGTAPSSDAVYAPLALSVMVGYLLTVRTRPNRQAAALVLVPAMVMDARFGLASLPAVAYAALVVALVRQVRGPRVVSGAAHQVIAFAAANVAEAALPMLPAWLVFAVVFATGRVLLWHVAARLDASAPQPREERPELLLSLALAPIGLLPLAAGDRLGDGAMVLAEAALLALLFVVREAVNLATARSEMEAERDRLERANQLQDDLIYLITHELRNPLTLVMSYSQMTRRAIRDDNNEQVPAYNNNIERAGRSIQRLMENLLQLNRLERSDALPTPEPVQVSTVVAQVLCDLGPLAKQKNQTLHSETPHGLPQALTVPMLLREALSNLVSNAVKYTPEGGEIRVWAEPGSRPKTIVIGVRDTGIGLSEDDQQRLFTKFFRSADPKVQRERGTGLGLALTHALVTRIGGTITVESTQGHGTTFRLTVPSVSASSTAASSATSDA
jgi:signal transduction histidine kinase